MASNQVQKRARKENSCVVNITSASYLSHCTTKLPELGDDQRLLNIFPEEIWLLITNKIKQAGDFENVQKSSYLFWRITLHRAPEFIFSSVLKILDKKVSLSVLNSENDQKIAELEENNNDHEQSAEIVKQCRKQILKLRLVCKNWCAAVDNYYQSINCISDVDFDAIFEDFYEEGDNLPKFLSHFASTHFLTDRNPFISRSLLICISDLNPNYLNFVAQLERLLEFYGQYIWYLGFEFFNIVQITSDHYMLMLNLLKYFPNIKEFNLDFNKVTVQPTCPKIQSQLITTVTENPINKIENLKRVKIVDMPNAILCGLCETNKQIAILEIFNRTQNQTFEDIHYFEVPNLQTLSLYLSSADVFLNIASRIKGNVCKVSVQLPAGIPNWPVVIKTMDRIWCSESDGDMLKGSDGHGKIPESNKPSCHTLENMPTLTITFSNQANLDLKTNSKHSGDNGLSKMSVNVDMPVNTETNFRKDTPKFMFNLNYTEFLTNAYKSKIWQRLKKLKNLVVGFYHPDSDTLTVSLYKREGLAGSIKA